jgi:hypothetical protein
MKRYCNMVGILAAFGLCAGAALGQWTNNPASPLVVGDATSDIPIVAPTSDGGCYIAWQGPVGGNQYNAVHIQRLDSAGHEMWPHNGVLAVPGNNSASFVGDFDMCVASDGNVIVANCTNFSDAANPTVHQSNVQKFSAVDGSRMWGTGGADVAVTTGTLPSRPVHVCSTPDGGCIVGYTLTTAANKGVPRFRRLNSAGAVLGPTTTPAYASNPQIFENGGNDSLSLTGLIPAGAPGDANDAAFIALVGWKVDTGTVGLQAQKFTSAGVVAPGWGTSGNPITLDGHGLTSFNFYLWKVIPDGSGGGIFAWSTFANSGFGAPTDAVLQHILSNGTPKFGTCCDGGGSCIVTTAADCASGNVFTPNGAPLNFVAPNSVPAGQGRYAAAVDYDAASGAYYLGTEQGPTASGVKRSVLVQKFDASGVRQWSDTGFTVIQESASNTQITPNWVKVSATSDGGCMVFGDMGRGFTTINAEVYGAKVVNDPGSPGYGMFAWNKVINSDVTTGKGRNGVVHVAGSDDAIVVHTSGSTMRAARVAASNGAPGVTPAPPSIDVDLPYSVTACDGDTIQLSVQVSGNTPMVFQWQRHYASTFNDAWWTLNNGDSSYQCNVPDDGTTYSGATTATLTINNIHSTNPTAACPSMDPSLNQYRVVIYNAGSDGVFNPPSVTSSSTQITVGSGACCAGDGSGACTSACNAAGCSQTGGTYQGDFSTCSPNPCGGACCSATACTISGSGSCSGMFMGVGTSCSPLPCDGSCCDNSIGACMVTTSSGCLTGSTFTAFGSCSPNICPQPGACCSNANGSCTVAVPSTCGGGNTFQGSGTVCDPNPCPPSGACCSNIDGSYCVVLTESVCTGISSRRWQGAATTCATITCPQPGACCNPATGACTLIAQPGCAAGSTFQGEGTVCDPNPCPQPTACCDASTGACSVVAQANQCSGQLAGGSCNPNPCPSVIACCQGTACFTSLPSLCGSPAPGGATSCTPSPCGASAGVCCRGSTCVVQYTSASACSASLNGALAGSVYIASGVCNASGNARTPCCYADYNKTAGITVGDIFDFLNDWFAGRKFAIVAGDGETGQLNVQNIFDFLNDWFAGGC